MDEKQAGRRTEGRAAKLSPRSARKRSAILGAAADMFLQHGYLGVSMDELAARAGVSKQTVYSHFESKETLFTEMATAMTDAASDAVHEGVPDPGEGDDLGDYLVGYAERQLEVVLSPRLMSLRRLAIGETGRFPALAAVLYERGPGRAMAALAALFARLSARGRLIAPDPDVAAYHFNWLVMGEAVNRAMLLGDDALPDAAARSRYAREGVRVFMAAYGVPARATR